MSYCRFNNESDVYIYKSGEDSYFCHVGFVSDNDHFSYDKELIDSGFIELNGACFLFTDIDSLLEFLNILLEKGYAVPEYAFARLLEEKGGKQ